MLSSSKTPIQFSRQSCRKSNQNKSSFAPNIRPGIVRVFDEEILFQQTLLSGLRQRLGLCLQEKLRCPNLKINFKILKQGIVKSHVQWTIIFCFNGLFYHLINTIDSPKTAFLESYTTKVILVNVNI